MNRNIKLGQRKTAVYSSTLVSFLIQQSLVFIQVKEPGKQTRKQRQLSPTIHITEKEMYF